MYYFNKDLFFVLSYVYTFSFLIIFIYKFFKILFDDVHIINFNSDEDDIKCNADCKNCKNKSCDFSSYYIDDK